ncbi:Cof-type HAD-IIB family hydrolase [Clostridium tarantellae]|uniref:Cof-type HAD-IIB family hydrolase n=1 Tax=Clostridium tarantellae TaxID=39493 RepID=A0A6I1MLI2_9CLOT|nr:Cof-type HAD-IIB family hydrolase [Clostridium tarantellae]MPQ43870.1 Cof-type HAD-IIB family hydrolase [Clostridium tarantellae]
MYKLIAIDMDGTLLNSNRQVSKENIEVIKKAVAKGTKVVITTGRSLNGIKSFLNEIGLIGENEYAICHNGAAIYRTDNFQLIKANPIKGKDLKELYKLKKEIGLYMHAYTNDDCLAHERNMYTNIEKLYSGKDVVILDYDNDVDDNLDIMKVLMFEEEHILNKKIEKIPKDYFEKYNIVRSLPVILEFLNKETNKGNGVKELSEYLGIKKEEIICIGDQQNDLEMIKFAGLGIAMGNATDEIKSCAEYITETNDNDGVAKAIEKFILKIKE